MSGKPSGADEQSLVVNQLIAEFMSRTDAGEKLDVAQFIAEHPECNAELKRHFENENLLDDLKETGSPGVAETMLNPGDLLEKPADETTAHTVVRGTADSETSVTRQHQIATSSATEISIPETFGRYAIQKVLGQGAMGAVYLAKDTQLDRNVALKIPKFGDGNGVNDQELLERFYREARASATLRSPNICPVYDVGEIDGQHYITMAYIEGRPLKDFTKSKKSHSEKQICSTIRKLALGLAEAHSIGVIHRDLKPANIMVDPKGEPVVMDFGLARRSSSDDVQVTQSGAILGTPAYMAPEQVAGDQAAIDHRVDIYALGIIMYELITNEMPFKGNLMAILQQIALNNPKKPSSIRKDIDPRLEKICLKMMAGDQTKRYQSMQQVAADLQEVLRTPGKRQKQEQAKQTSPKPTSIPSANEESNPALISIEQPKSYAEQLRSKKTARPAKKSKSAGNAKSGSLSGFSGSNSTLLIGGGVGGLLLLLGIIFFVRVGKYDVQITLDDPSITLSVDGETLNINNGSEVIKLSAGEHQLQLQKDGLKTHVEEFTVTKDGKTALTAKVVNGQLDALLNGEETPQIAARNPSATSQTKKAAWQGWPADAPPAAVAPFDAAQAKSHQQAWANHLGVPVEYENSIGMKFRLIPPGEFQMNASNLTADVLLTKPFHAGIHEVTQGQWVEVMTTTPWAKQKWVQAGPDFAASFISWENAVEFCNELTKRELATGTIPAGWKYRLPSEAEWEWACRAGSNAMFSFGDDPAVAEEYAWVRSNTTQANEEYAHRVGLKKPNAWGLHDVHGNLWEHCSDWYAHRLPGGRDPLGASEGTERVHRGGSWYTPESGSRSAARQRNVPSYANRLVGFRVILQGTPGNGHDGKIIGAKWVKVESTPQQKQYSLQFSDAGDTVTFANAGVAPKGPLTMEMWVASDPPPATTRERRHFASIGVDQGIMGLDLRYHHDENNAISFLTGIEGPTNLWTTGSLTASEYKPNAWTHFVHIWTGSELQVYINGQRRWGAQKDLDDAGKRLPEDVLATLGGETDLGKQFLGRIRELRISNSIRYSKNFELPSPEVPFENDEQTLALYHFDEGSGDVLKDSSGNGHDGKIIGATWVSQSNGLGAIPTRSSQQITHGLSFSDPESCVKFVDTSIDYRKPFAVEMLCNFAADPVDRFRVLFNSGNFQIRAAPPIGKAPATLQALVDGLIDPKSAGWQRAANFNASDHSKTTHLLIQWTGSDYQLWLDGHRLETRSSSWDGALVPGTPKFEESLNRLTNTNYSLGNSITSQGKPSSVALKGSIWATTIYQGIVTDQDHFNINEAPSSTARVVAAYHFHEGSGDILKDSSGNGHHGKIVGAKWVKVEAPQLTTNYALTPAGDLEKEGLIAELPRFIRIDDTMTIEMTITPFAHAAARESRTLISFAGALVLKQSEENLTWMRNNDHADPRWEVVSLQQLPLHKPLRIATVSTGKQLRLFVEGQLVGTHDLVIPPSSPSSRIVLSPWSALGSGHAPFDGTIDEIRFSNIARYDADYVPLERLTADNQTVALYHFDEGTGDVLKDSSGNGHDGKIIGAKWVTFDGEATLKSPVVDSDTYPGQFALSFPELKESYVEVPTLDSKLMDGLLRDKKLNLTIEFWLKRDRNQISPHDHYAGWSGSYLFVRSSPGGGYVEGGEWGGRGAPPVGFYDTAAPTRTLKDEATWTHVAAVLINPNEYRLFINGKLVDKKPAKWSWPGSPDPFELMQQAAGLMGETRVSTVARYDKDFTPEFGFKPDKDTLALYHFDEASGEILKDASGNGHDGKIIGAKWVSRPNSKVGDTKTTTAPASGGGARPALRFPAEVDEAHVDVPSLVFEDFRDKSFTLETWVRRDLSQTRPNRPIFGFHSAVWIATDGGLGSLQARFSDGSAQWPHAKWLGDEEEAKWFHAALVRDVANKTIHFYVNGRLVGRQVVKPLIRGQRSLLSFGVPGTYRFYGEIGESRFSSVMRYDRDFIPPTDLKPDEHTIALYKFGEGTGDILKDSSGNGHDGKIIGAKWVGTEGKSISTSAPPPAVFPFDAAQAKAHQEAWADHLGLPVEKQVELPGGEKMIFMLIPPGEFLMGSNKEDQTKFLAQSVAINDLFSIEEIPQEGPQHRVRITQPFYLGKYEVTQGQWHTVAGSNPSQAQGSPSHPVESVSWEDIQPFIAKLNDASTADFQFALPTEAQWEFACRAGTSSAWYNSDDEQISGQSGWTKTNAGGETNSVGLLAPNAFGIFDLHGNVWEWCVDWHGGDYYANSSVDDPVGPSLGSVRVTRGGSFNNRARLSRSATRGSSPPDHRSPNLGFRLALSIDTAKLKTASSVAPPSSMVPLSTADADHTSMETSLYFSEPEDEVVIPTLMDDSDPLTLELWLQRDSNDRIAHMQILGFSENMSIAMNANGVLDFQMPGTGGEDGPLEGWENRGVDKPIHIAGVRDPEKKEIRLYHDGKLIKTSPGEIRRGDGSLQIASNAYQWQGDGGHHFSGWIDEIRVSKSVRYKKDFTPERNFKNDAETAALYHFETGTGDLLKDSSGNGHDGKIIGAMWLKAGSELANEALAWRPIFDGKTLNGWTQFGGLKDSWQVKDGLLVSGEGGGFGKGNRLVYTQEEFQDVDVRMECQLTPQGNSGLFVRVKKFADGFDGYEAQLAFQDSSGTGGTFIGDLYKHSRGAKTSIGPDEWFILEMQCRGNSIKVFVNGTETAHYLDASNQFPSGHVALQELIGRLQIRSIAVRKAQIKLASPN